jgi:hypothetical protein
LERAGVLGIIHNVGSSVGISVVSYLLIRNEQINHATMSGHVTAVNHAFDNSIVLHAWGPWTASGRAALDPVIQMQAAIISYIDSDRLTALAAAFQDSTKPSTPSPIPTIATPPSGSTITPPLNRSCQQRI